MSLEADWYSTMFTVLVMIGQMLAGFAFGTVLLACFRKNRSIAQIISPAHFHQLGNLLLAFVMLWTYMAFGQFLIIYSGNLPHEISWYLHRIAGGWKWIAVVLAVFHFFVPFFVFLFRAAKRNVLMLTVLAALVFVAHIVDVFWLVLPSLHTRGLSISWLDFAAPAGIGGIWIATFLFRLQQAELVPQNDPRLQWLLANETQR